MNRIVLMVLRNLTRIPGAWIKLCRYAKNPAAYPEIEAWRHIQYILNRAITTGNIDLEVTGLENIPQEGSFVMFANHQGMFDVVAIAASCKKPLGIVYKKELTNVPVLKEILIHVGGDICRCAPSGAAVFHAVAVFLCVLAFRIDSKPQNAGNADAGQ